MHTLILYVSCTWTQTLTSQIALARRGGFLLRHATIKCLHYLAPDSISQKGCVFPKPEHLQTWIQSYGIKPLQAVELDHRTVLNAGHDLVLIFTFFEFLGCLKL